jgi:DivIVA protein
MSYFSKPTTTVDEQPTEAYDAFSAEAALVDDAPDSAEAPDSPRPAGTRLADFRGRVSRALQSLDRGPVLPQSQHALEEGERDPLAADPTGMLEDVQLASADAGFPVGPLGYNRSAVDERIAVLEQELEELRAQATPVMSINDEIERLGEQTASILVVAHDQARETTRMAQEEAERRIAEASASADAITREARRQLDALDNETDVIWRERMRLLDDARAVGQALIALAEEASGRFPPEVKVTDARPAGL